MGKNHIPYGYRIVNGDAVVNEEEAAKVKVLCDLYLSGLSLVQAGKEAGFDMVHSGVKNMMINKRYLGDDFFPPILSKQTHDAVVSELSRREECSMHVRKTKDKKDYLIKTEFAIEKGQEENPDPMLNAQAIYESIREV